MNCACCGSVIKDDVFINCCICNKSFKTSCVKLSRIETAKINSNTGLSWTCADCGKFGNDLNGLKAAIIALQDDIKILKAASISDTPNTLVNTEEIIQEVIERDRRKTNVMVFGVSEAVNLSRAEQRSADTEVLRNIFGSIDFRIGDLIPLRLGKYDPSKISPKRPIKLCFSSEGDVVALLKKSKSLKQSKDFSGVFISRDRTPFQQKLYGSVRDELRDRKSKGENNIRIKYSNGIPRIVSVTDLN